MNLILLDVISGVCFGLEIYTGDHLEEDDVFAFTLWLGIFSVTYIRRKKQEA